ncbi:MAG TPA: metalloregulator ArsR/SmtB family transcription factor [Acidimicrobiia bacterium]|nr:metalloregulator ArsR/SmtB family transcription factor [Acidimicrobiia bacterium]
MSSLKVPVDQTFAALADPTRVEIVVRLHRGSATVSELAEPYDMSLRAVLKHVQVLEAAGLVRTVKDGRVRRCELERRRLDEAERWMDDLRRRWERRLDRIEAYIEREKE